MKRFAQLYAELDETNKTNEKLAALRRYLSDAPAEDAAWAVYFLSGRRLKRLVSTAELREWVLEASGLSEWLLAESYDAVGDLAETIALLLPPAAHASDEPLHLWVETKLLPMRDADTAGRREIVLGAWSRLDDTERFVFNKLITGAFRVGVSQRLVTRALADFSGVDAAVIAHRLMGDWEPTARFFHRLVSSETEDADQTRPYPFFLAHPLEGVPEALGPIEAWQAEWKWDGIRAQLVRRQDQTHLWSRGEDLITERFPELVEAAESLPEGTVLDGELLGWADERPLPFAKLQHRIGRKRLTQKILSEIPAVYLAFDLLELDGRDVRSQPLLWRFEQLRQLLEAHAPDERIRLSPTVEAASWQQLAELRESSRDRRAEGLMLKRRDSAYGVGRPRGTWWKWKVDPYTVDAVLIYAQRGSGRRASLYTDYTFAVWDDGALVPFAKAYSGLTAAEIHEVDAFVRSHTRERFGPVRRVEPQLVFELAFENIQQSTRHKSGVAVRFPRIVRWRRDKKPEDADRLELLRRLLREAEA